MLPDCSARVTAIACTLAQGSCCSAGQSGSLRLLPLGTLSCPDSCCWEKGRGRQLYGCSKRPCSLRVGELLPLAPGPADAVLPLGRSKRGVGQPAQFWGTRFPGDSPCGAACCCSKGLMQRMQAPIQPIELALPALRRYGESSHILLLNGGTLLHRAHSIPSSIYLRLACCCLNGRGTAVVSANAHTRPRSPRAVATAATAPSVRGHR